MPGPEGAGATILVPDPSVPSSLSIPARGPTIEPASLSMPDGADGETTGNGSAPMPAEHDRRVAIIIVPSQK